MEKEIEQLKVLVETQRDDADQVKSRQSELIATIKNQTYKDIEALNDEFDKNKKADEARSQREILLFQEESVQKADQEILELKRQFESRREIAFQSLFKEIIEGEFK